MPVSPVPLPCPLCITLLIHRGIVPPTYSCLCGDVAAASPPCTIIVATSSSVFRGKQFPINLTIMAALLPTTMVTDSMDHSFNVNITGSALHSASTLLSSRRACLGQIHKRNMFRYPKNRKHANLLMQEYQHCSRQTPNIYYQSSSDRSGQCVPIYFKHLQKYLVSVGFQYRQKTSIMPPTSFK